MIGNLIKRKSMVTAVIAMEKILSNFPDARLQIVGEGPEKIELLGMVKKLGLSSNVEFCGRVSADELAYKLSTCGVFCHTSASEAVSHVIDGAMAPGRPVVCTDISANADTVEHGKSGFFFKLGDSEALASYVEKIFGDPDISQIMGSKAREHSQKQDWNSIGEKYYKLYLFAG